MDSNTKKVAKIHKSDNYDLSLPKHELSDY